MVIQRRSAVFSRWQTAWSNAFTPVRSKHAFSQSPAEAIAKLINAGRTMKNLPGSYLRDLAVEAKRVGTGWRSKNSADGELTGEQGIEAPLLNKRTITVKTPTGELLGTATFSRQQVYLMASMGQVKPDLIGSFSFANKKKPIIVSYEVKVGANNCGYALVECCRQVDILRRSPKSVKHLVESEMNTNSAWGAVIAPPSYYNNKKNRLDKAIDISKMLKRGPAPTKLRIAFLSWDSLSNELVYLGGNWID